MCKYFSTALSKNKATPCRNICVVIRTFKKALVVLYSLYLFKPICFSPVESDRVNLGWWRREWLPSRDSSSHVVAQTCLLCLWGVVCFQGAVLINDAARIVDRHMTFQEGIAYGIDQLLEPPGLGAHCDMLENRTTYVSKLSKTWPDQKFRGLVVRLLCLGTDLLLRLFIGFAAPVIIVILKWFCPLLIMSQGRCGRCHRLSSCPFKHVDTVLPGQKYKYLL